MTRTFCQVWIEMEKMLVKLDPGDETSNFMDQCIVCLVSSPKKSLFCITGPLCGKAAWSAALPHREPVMQKDFSWHVIMMNIYSLFQGNVYTYLLCGVCVAVIYNLYVQVQLTSWVYNHNSYQAPQTGEQYCDLCWEFLYALY